MSCFRVDLGFLFLLLCLVFSGGEYDRIWSVVSRCELGLKRNVSGGSCYYDLDLSFGI